MKRRAFFWGLLASPLAVAAAEPGEGDDLSLELWKEGIRKDRRLERDWNMEVAQRLEANNTVLSIENQRLYRSERVLRCFLEKELRASDMWKHIGRPDEDECVENYRRASAALEHARKEL